jgi:hypothetical protein
LSVFFSLTALLARIASTQGKKELAEPAMREAVDLWRAAIVAEPSLERAEAVSKYVAWFEQRLAENRGSGP